MIHYIYKIFGEDKTTTASKMDYLDNFILVFGIENLTVVLNNCDEEIYFEVKKRGIKRVARINIKDVSACRFTIIYAIETFKNEDYVYFAETGFLYKPDTLSLLKEGLETSDYVTLYKKTFAVQIKTLKEDFGIWQRVPIASFPVWQRLKKSNLIFKLRYFYKKKRKLISLMPKMCHLKLNCS